MSYDKKYRERVLALVDSGKKQEEVRTMLGLGVNTITKWKKLRAEKGSLENKPLKRRWRKIDPEKLQADVREYPDDFNRERAKRLKCSESGIRKAMKGQKITRKKRVQNWESETKPKERSMKRK
jgi:transposase